MAASSFTTTMEVDGTEYPLRRIFFSGHRERDTKGRPAAATSWFVMVMIDVQESTVFAEWMIDPRMKKKVEIKYYDAENPDAVLKSWTIDEGVCYGMKESFISDADYMFTSIIFSGKEITNGNATLQYTPK